MLRIGLSQTPPPPAKQSINEKSAFTRQMLGAGRAAGTETIREAANPRARAAAKAASRNDRNRRGQGVALSLAPR